MSLIPIWMNPKKRKRVRELIERDVKRHFGMKWIIEEICFFTAVEVLDNVYEIYVRVAEKNKEFDLTRNDYWNYWNFRTNEHIIIDLNKSRTDVIQWRNRDRFFNNFFGAKK